MVLFLAACVTPTSEGPSPVERPESADTAVAAHPDEDWCDAWSSSLSCTLHTDWIDDAYACGAPMTAELFGAGPAHELRLARTDWGEREVLFEGRHSGALFAHPVGLGDWATEVTLTIRDGERRCGSCSQVFIGYEFFGFAPGTDVDGDGVPWEEDCDWCDDTVHPGAADPTGDGIDSNCDGVDG